MSRILMAIDPSLSCTGVAIFDTSDSDVWPPKLISTYTIETKTPKNMSRARKLSIIAKRFRELKDEYKPDVMVYESGFSRFVKSTQALYQVQGVMLLIFNEIETLSYAPSSVKKTICGKGNVKKDFVREAVEEIYPKEEFANNDETDAVAVGIHYLSQKEAE